MKPLAALLALGLLAGACAGESPSGGETTETTAQPTSTSVTTSESTASSSVESASGQLPRLTGAYTVEVVERWPHDPSSFTQGLEWADGLLLESTGRTGESRRRYVQPETGEVLTEAALEDNLFGEGITIVDGEVVQLTWLAGLAIYSDAEDLVEQRRVEYSEEGWGVCYNGADLVTSDGSSNLSFQDPVSFVTRTEVLVQLGGVTVDSLNELECLDGTVLANIWKSDFILAIDPDDGQVTATIDASVLRQEAVPDFTGNDQRVLNGIAVHEPSGDLLLTGKNWPYLYRVTLTQIAPTPDASAAE